MNEKIRDPDDIIEDVESKSIPADDRKLWSHFIEGLAPSHAKAFFNALRKEVVESETLILEQGRANHRLFLIVQGQVQLFCRTRTAIWPPARFPPR